MISKYVKYFLTALAFIITASSSAQFDSIVKQMQKEFGTFTKEIKGIQQKFISDNDSIYSKFLREPWESFEIYYKPRPEGKPKPDVQPVVPRNYTPPIQPQIIVIPDSNVNEKDIPEEIIILPEKKALPPEYETNGMDPGSIDFYGSSTSFWFPPQLPGIKKLSAADIADYFDKVSSMISVVQMVIQSNMLKDRMKLNDWAYLQLIKVIAKQITSNSREAALLSWVLMLKSGYNAKVGYAGDHVYLMISSIQEIYGLWSSKIGNEEFYIVSDEPVTGEVHFVNLQRRNFPEFHPFSLVIKNWPDFEKLILSKEFTFRGNSFNVDVNQHLIDFLNHYPTCGLGIYFTAPMSEEVALSLDRYLGPVMKNLTGKQKVAFLLEFTQKTFTYQNDKQKFGREKYYFPDEVFYYNASDCEDRSILFSYLVHRYTGFETVGLSFPGHVNTAVNIPGEKSGNLISYNNHSYSVCDPTFMNSQVGSLPEQFRTTTPKIVTFQ
jgi:hypothetical protein